MVMHGQTDFMELLLGNNTDVLNVDGEINFYVPHAREFDQQLDMDEYDFSSLLPTLDILDTEAVTYYEEAEKPAPATAGLEEPPSPADLDQQLYFQYPAVTEYTEISDLTAVCSTSTDTSGFSDTTDPDSSASSFATRTPGSPADSVFTAPPTPSTASSLDSGWGSGTSRPSAVKSEVKFRIQARRRLQGKEELRVVFREPEPEMLTEEEEQKRDERRGKNKLAAQKCRGKKKERTDVLEEETDRLEGLGDKLKIDIQKLIQERDHLRDLISIHKPYCPKMQRGSSDSF